MAIDKMNKIHYLFCLIAASFLAACSSNETEIRDIPTSPGEYESILNLDSNAGQVVDTKVIASDRFTDEYDSEYIYIHTVGEDGEDQWVRTLVRTDLPNCPQQFCQGFKFCYRIDEQGNKCIVGTDEDGNEKTIPFDSFEDEVYLSSTAKEIWKGTTSEDSPLSESSVLVRNDDGDITGQGGNRGEIYRSGNLKISELIDNSHVLPNTITMERKCSAFRIWFIFTDGDRRILNEKEWYEATGTQPSDWSGKMYFGPCFGETYNIETGESTFSKDDGNGYYASWNQQYHVFEQVQYSPGSSGEGDAFEIYEGFGVSTVASYLVTPYDSEGHSKDNMIFYAFIKYKDPDVNSDAGSHWFTYTFRATVPSYNTTNLYVVVCDVNDLVEEFQNQINSTNTASQNLTRSITSELHKMEIKPIKAFYLQ